jgi:uncharacterized membrane protein YjfL (UPF0719 family)
MAVTPSKKPPQNKRNNTGCLVALVGVIVGVVASWW